MAHLFGHLKQNDNPLETSVMMRNPYTKSTFRAIGAAICAIDEINQNGDILKDFHINYIWKDDGCNRKDALANVTDLWASGYF